MNKEFNCNFNGIVAIRRRAIEHRMSEEKLYRRLLQVLPEYEYEIEAAKAMLRKIKIELAELLNVETEKRTNAQNIRIKQLELFKSRALTNLANNKILFNSQHTSVKMHKNRYKAYKRHENAILQLYHWAYEIIDNEVNRITSTILKDQPMPVINSKRNLLRWEMPVKFEVNIMSDTTLDKIFYIYTMTVVNQTKKICLSTNGIRLDEWQM